MHKMKKIKILLSALLAFPNAFALNPFEPLEEIGNWVFKIGSFTWISDKMLATRFALFLIMFSLVYWILVIGVKGEGSAIFKGKAKNPGIVIAFVFAAISILFMPEDMILGIGNMYSGFLAIILIGFPAFGILFLGILLTRENEGSFWGMSMGSEGSRFPHADNSIARHTIRFTTAMIAMALLTGVAGDYGVGFTLIILPLLIKRK